ncbi:MAG: hypothetical protein Q7S87_08630 [Agitococcus sp.]|nr:hypothetical protein [Agitococcus sp.]MDO9177635.1 hypothetical protein [Agitococcus sp.]
MDANEKPSERSYNVKYTNLAGGYIEVTGILTHNGWPHVAHGLAIGMD